MKKIILLLLTVITFLPSCKRVEPNYQGVLMTDFGKNGKSDYRLVKGNVWIFAPGRKLFQVPLFEQRAVFEDQIVLKASNNTEFTTQPNYSYKVIEDRAIDVIFASQHAEGKGTFMRALENNILEPKILDLAKDVANKYHTDKLMSDGGNIAFQTELEDLVKTALEGKGLELITFSCQLAFSKSVTTRIDERNEINTTLGVLDQKIEAQKKTNELIALQTEGLRIKSLGLTDEILIDRFITKWDGQTPLYGIELEFLKVLEK